MVKNILKRTIVKISTLLKTTISAFLYMNMIFSAIYISFPTIPDGIKYNWIEFIIHTFIASLTLSIPEFIKFPTDGVSLDIVVLFHMFFAYLFLGILVSMIYRKLTRA